MLVVCGCAEDGTRWVVGMSSVRAVPKWCAAGLWVVDGGGCELLLEFVIGWMVVDRQGRLSYRMSAPFLVIPDAITHTRMCKARFSHLA